MRTPAKFKQYTAAELYIGQHEAEATEGESPATGVRPTGNAFLDTFVSNLYQYGIHNSVAHAKWLGIRREELCTTVQVLTGMLYTDFVTTFVLLMAADLLKPQKKDLKAISQRLGFGSYSGFYRFMMRHGKVQPSWV